MRNFHLVNLTNTAANPMSSTGMDGGPATNNISWANFNKLK